MLKTSVLRHSCYNASMTDQLSIRPVFTETDAQRFLEVIQRVVVYNVQIANFLHNTELDTLRELHKRLSVPLAVAKVKRDLAV